MKIGIDSFSCHLHFGKHWFTPSKVYDLEWFCEKCIDLKVDGIHIDPMHIDLENDLEWLLKVCARHNLFIELGAIGITPEEITPSILAAKKLNSKILRIFIGGSCEDGSEISKKRAAWAKEQLKRSLEIAEKNNIILALENHGDLFFEDFMEVISIDNPFLGVCFDTGNFSTIGIDPREALNILLDKIVCTHIKDIYPPDSITDAEPFGIGGYKYHFGQLGKGLMPLKEIIKKLKTAKQEFNLSIEIHTPFRKTLSEEELLKLEDVNLSESVKCINRLLFQYLS
jgi:sugar phosphate isomerase/epimerase